VCATYDVYSEKLALPERVQLRLGCTSGSATEASHKPTMFCYRVTSKAGESPSAGEIEVRCKVWLEASPCSLGSIQ